MHGPLTANELLRDRAVRHAVFLERLKLNEVRRIHRFLDRSVFPDLTARIEAQLSRIFDSGERIGERLAKLDRLKAMQVQVRAIADRAAEQIESRLTNRLVDIGVSEVSWQTDALRGSAPLVAELVQDIAAPRLVRSIVVSRPMQGRVLRQWTNAIGRDLASRVEQQVKLGLTMGESIPTIVQRVRGRRAAGFRDGVLQTTRRNAEGVVRTAVNHVTTHAREATYEANSDLIQGVQWVSTLDARTTEICAALDGRVFRVGDGPRPPAHFNCRSTTVPALKSWESIGIKDPGVGTRASMNGQVPASMTYGKWLQQQPAAFQDEVLGKGRAELFRRGHVPIERFIDKRLRPLTLRELERLEAQLGDRTAPIIRLRGEKAA